MTNRLGIRLIGAGALCVGIVGASLAQDSEIAQQITFNINQRISAVSNQALEANSAGNTTTARTGLGFVLTSNSELNKLRLDANMALRFTDGPGGSSGKVDQPRLTIGYTRVGAASQLTFNANYNRSQISFLRPLEDFLDEDSGQIILPTDSDDLNGSGTRTAYGASIGLELMRDAPLSFNVNLSTNRRDYTDVSNDDLFDRQTDRFGVTANLRFSPVAQGRVSASISRYRAEDTEQTRRTTKNLSFGYTRSLNRVLDLEASVGLVEIDTDTTAGESQTNGTNASLGLTLARPNGELSARLSQVTNRAGQRLNFTVSRSLRLAQLSMNGSLGLSRAENDQTSTTAQLSLNYPLPSGALNLSLNRSIRLNDSDNDENLVTTVNASWNHQINEWSSLQLRGAMTSGSTEDRTNLGLTYSYALTKDWSLNTGISQRTRTPANGDRATSQTIFFGVGRSFDLPF